MQAKTPSDNFFQPTEIFTMRTIGQDMSRIASRRRVNQLISLVKEFV
jgi:hypothetical protein